ncbi:MAG: hypothetical protein QE263_00565 [Vampirovibrionales bacterium]|nr:hypothetical protein [Vampirovibrionales bacterium]
MLKAKKDKRHKVIAHMLLFQYSRSEIAHHIQTNPETQCSKATAYREIAFVEKEQQTEFADLTPAQIGAKISNMVGHAYRTSLEAKDVTTQLKAIQIMLENFKTLGQFKQGGRHESDNAVLGSAIQELLKGAEES